ncbi:MAG: DMT family transporter [Clostridiales bacterium]|nr:DMT family transporter [Clostridiales bacterium]
MSPKLGRAALFSAALIWGSSFFVMKDAVAGVPVFLLLAIRFTVGCALLGAIFWRKWRRCNPRLLLHGAVVGVLLFAAYTAQTYGLKETTPGKNAFLTAVYCVLVPFVNWLLLRRRPTGWNWLAAVMCMGGIGLVSLDGRLSMNRGDALTLLGGVFYALHLVAVSRFGEEDDAVLLTTIQFGASALCCWLCHGLFETAPVFPQNAWVELIYLAVFATTIALLLQNVGQSVTPAAQASILLSLESVFGVLFSVICYGEKVTLRLLAGFGLIFLAVLASETQFSFLRRKCAQNIKTDGS